MAALRPLDDRSGAMQAAARHDSAIEIRQTVRDRVKEVMVGRIVPVSGNSKPSDCPSRLNSHGRHNWLPIIISCYPIP